MRVAVIIPWWTKTCHQERKDALECVVQHWSDGGYTVCLGEEEDDPFNRSKARNRAVEKTDADVLVFADGDTLIPFEQVEAGLEMLHLSWVIPYREYFNLTRELSHQIVAKSRTLERPKRRDWQFKPLSWAGVLIVTREMYEAIGGYDERFVGWGWEDVAFRVKLDAEVSHHVRTDGYVCHLWHPANVDEGFTTELELANRSLFDRDYRDRYDWKDERGKV